MTCTPITRRAVCLAGVASLTSLPSAVGALLCNGARGDLDVGVCRGPADAATLADGGASYLEVSCRAWLVPELPDAVFAERRRELLEAALPARAANSFLPGSHRATGPGVDMARLLKYAETACRRAAEVGIKTITFGSAGARSVPEGFSRADAELQFVAVLARLGDVAARHGVCIAVEPLHAGETNFINLVSAAHRLVAIVDHDAVRITADLFHMLRGDEGPDALRDAAPFIHHVHVAEKRNRTAPGTDGDDFGPYLRALSDIGYDGRLSLEGRFGDLAIEVPRAIATLRAQAGEQS